MPNDTSDSGSDNNINNHYDENLDWNDNPRDYREFPFTGPSGVNSFPNDITCPFEVLKTFLSDDIIQNLVEYTNAYATVMKETPEIIEQMNNKKRSAFNLWVPVTFDEMWVYIAIITIMGIINKPDYHMFWSKDHIFSTPIFSRLMRRDRFEQIRKMLHFVDPLNEDPEDSLRKLSTFLDSMADKFQRNYTPQQNVAVDEYLSLWKGRLKFRVYIPNKCERYGVKIYMCCESETGYLYKFIVYSGADTKYVDPGEQFPKPFEEYTNYSKVVLSLMDGLYNQGYSVTLDNLYTYPELLLALYQNGTDCFGTLRKKNGLPEIFGFGNQQKVLVYHRK